MKSKKSRLDYTLLAVTGFLVLIGLLILWSVSAFLSEKNLANPYHFLLHQLIFGIILGAILGFLAFKLPLAKLKKRSVVFLLLNIVLLFFVFLPVIGWKAGGATRWLKLGAFTFQPSELLKITFPLYLAAWLSRHRALLKKPTKKFTKKWNARKAKITPARLSRASSRHRLRPSQRGTDQKIGQTLFGFIPFLIILSLISILLVFQPDIGTLAIIAAVAVLMYFIAETSFWHNLLIVVLIMAAFFALIRVSPYRVERLLVFFNPETDPMGAGYQIKQALIAVGSGGIWGKGFGLSQQKLGFLPQPLGDSIFAIFAEEAGFLGAIFLVFLFLIFLWRGLKIAKNSKSSFFKLLSFGLTIQIVLQALVNTSALIGLLPLTGIPLPFISYGGSHLVAELIGVGILLNISKEK